MKKIQVWGWLISGFLKKHKKVILLGVSLGISASIFFIWVLPYIPRPVSRTRIGIVGQYSKNELPHFILNKVSQGLTYIMPDGHPVPALAERWTASPDSTSYTFFLRDNIFWQDGTKLTARDLSYNIPDVESKILDEKTIQFNLKSSYSPFPTLLSRQVFKKNFTGVGDYKIKSVKEKNGYVESLLLEAPREILEIKFYPNLSALTTAFSLGEIDQIRDVVKNPFSDKQDWKDSLTVDSSQNNNQYVALFFNNADPMLVDKTFRQALAYAIEKPSDESRALTPLSIESWAYNPDVKPYDYDPKRANELLEKSLGSLDKATTITLRLATTQQYLEDAEKIKKDWESQLGIKVVISVINAIPTDFQILLASEEIPSDPDQYSLWHSTQQQNFIKFNNKRIDKILEDARQEQNEEKRKELYDDFQKYFVEESPVVFMYYPKVYTISRNNTIKTVIRQFLDSGKSMSKAS